MGMIKVPPVSISKFKDNYMEIFESGTLAEGKWNKELAKFYVDYTKARQAIPFCSNGSGLVAILMLLKRYRGYKNVFIQSNTMYGVKTIAITSGLNYVGAVPCSLPHLMPTMAQVAAYIDLLPNPSECVFLITHIGGIVNPDIRDIAALCQKKGVALVEDCAHSAGATLDGAHTGLFGVAGVYSLYATKAITAGEGGIAVTNDEELGNWLSKFQIYDRFDQKMDVGVNFRISELQALFAYCVSEQTEEIIANKATIADQYIKACKESGIEFVDPYSQGQRGNHYKFTLIARRDAREEFSKITLRTSPVYDYRLGPDPLNVHKKHICLPIWYDLEETTVKAVVAEVKACGAGAAATPSASL